MHIIAIGVNYQRPLSNGSFMVAYDYPLFENVCSNVYPYQYLLQIPVVIGNSPQCYPLVINHSNWQPYINGGVLMGNLSISGGFSIAMFDYQKVTHLLERDYGLPFACLKKDLERD